MKNIAFILCVIALPLQAAMEKYTIDPKHTYVLWHAGHFGFSNPSGKWHANGTLEFDKDNLQNSKVNITIKTGDLVTGLKDFDKHLKGKEFFEVDKYPEATFVSEKIEMENNELSKVHGTLKLHGVSKPVTLDAKINKIGASPINDRQTIGFTASTVLKRSEFGITSFLPGVSDEVKIDIEGEAYKP